VPGSRGRYQRYGWHYDLLTGERYRPGEDIFYAALARTYGGPALEPACGAARVLVTIYRQGIEVWGTDAAPAMLDLGHRRLSAARLAEPGLRDVPFTLLHMPLAHFSFDRRFGLVLLPLDSFRLLRSDHEQSGFLAAARQHLLPRGRLALDVTLPQPELPPVVAGAALPRPGGGTVRAITRWLQEGDDMIEETVLELTGSVGCSVVRETFRDPYRIVTADDLIALLGDCGWNVEQTWADHEHSPYRPGAERLVLVAAPEG
jgi:hypothetical protein